MNQLEIRATLMRIDFSRVHWSDIILVKCKIISGSSKFALDVEQSNILVSAVFIYKRTAQVEQNTLQLRSMLF